MFRENLNMDISFFDHPHSWSLQCISNDGNPMLEMPERGGDYIMTSNSMINLVEYVAKIGIEPEIIERMRLL